MVRWSHYVTGVDGVRVVSAFGWSYVALAVGKAMLALTTGRSVTAAGIDVLLVGLPGVALLYGGRWLRESRSRATIHPETYWRIGAWSLAGALVMVSAVGLLSLEPGVVVENGLWTSALASAMGTVGGVVVGVNDAHAVTQARQSGRHNRELTHQNERLDRFASMLAHEVRNPLTIARMYLPQAADGDQTAAEEVETALDRIEEMTDVLLVTARGTDADVDCEPVSLSEAAATAWEDLSTPTADLVVDSDLTVLADPVHLRHLLENLFKNAVEHGSTSPRSQAHEDAVEHDHERVTIRVGDLPSGFYIEDDGPGIPAEEREAVFDAGYTTDADGIGLGLTFVAQLVETYGWDCTITDATGGTGGTRFEFTDVDLVSTDRRQVH